MSLRIVRYVLSSILATLVATALFTPASAQEATQELEPGAFIIRLVDFAPESPLEVRARTERGRITATVDGVECTSVDASTPSLGRLVLGTPDQPEVCSRPGARVVLHADQGELWEKFELVPGKVAELGNYAPMPLDTGPITPATSGHGSTSGGPATTLSAVAVLLSLLGIGLLVTGRRVSRS